MMVNELWVYPVKGMQGIEVDSIEITDLGIVGDREFAIWEDGRLVDQKVDQWVASIAADYDHLSHTLTLSHPEHGEYVHRRRDEGEKRQGKWILDEFEVTDQGDEVAVWISTILDRPVRLVDAQGAVAGQFSRRGHGANTRGSEDPVQRGNRCLGRQRGLARGPEPASRSSRSAWIGSGPT